MYVIAKGRKLPLKISPANLGTVMDFGISPHEHPAHIPFMYCVPNTSKLTSHSCNIPFMYYVHIYIYKLPATVPSKYFFPRMRIPLQWFARGGRRLLLEQRSESPATINKQQQLVKRGTKKEEVLVLRTLPLRQPWMQKPCNRNCCVLQPFHDEWQGWDRGFTPHALNRKVRLLSSTVEWLPLGPLGHLNSFWLQHVHGRWTLLLIANNDDVGNWYWLVKELVQ